MLGGMEAVTVGRAEAPGMLGSCEGAEVEGAMDSVGSAESIAGG